MANQTHFLSAIVPSAGASVYSSLNSLFQVGALSGACASLATSIWNRKSAERIQHEIDRCTNLDQKFTSYQLTPLHLAAIQENGAAMDALLDAGAAINAKDDRGFTALHHLALKGNAKAASLFLERGADPKIKNDFGGTYADLLRFNAPFRKQVVEFEPDPSLFSAHPVDRSSIDSVCLSSFATKTDEVVAKPAALFEMWKHDMPKLPANLPGIKPYFNSLLEEKYKKFKEHPPALEVRNFGSEGTFCGVFAKERIRKGDIFAEYTGEAITEPARAKLKNTAYLQSEYPPIDGIKYRSPAAMARDAFPNAATFTFGYKHMDIEGIDGLPERKILVAIDDIQPGEQITINYGSVHRVKKIPFHVELKKDAIRAFFKENSWKSILNKVADFASPSENRFFEAACYVEKLVYLFETVKTFQWVVQSGLITQKDIDLIRAHTKKDRVAAGLVDERCLEWAEEYLKVIKNEL